MYNPSEPRDDHGRWGGGGGSFGKRSAGGFTRHGAGVGADESQHSRSVPLDKRSHFGIAVDAQFHNRKLSTREKFGHLVRS